MAKIRVTVWNEFVHEKEHEAVRTVYPDGIHKAIAEAVGPEFDWNFATLDMPEHGLTNEVLARTDVLIWWGHMAHDKVRDEIAARVQQRVLAGMGLIVLHSGHLAKPFTRLMGTACTLSWREADEKERLWVIEPSHPIVKGLGRFFELPAEEMYGERFDVPEPDATVFISWFEGGEVFRSGMTWTRGAGKVFYFRPGHETYPTYKRKEIALVIRNAIGWAAFQGSREAIVEGCPNITNPLEPIKAQRREP
jgi:trehalose utilization protein